MESQVVYFIQEGADGPIKIGVAFDPARRLAELQIGNPRLLRVLGTFPGAVKLERVLHKALADHRVGGEWFELCEDICGLFECVGLLTEAVYALEGLAVPPSFRTEIAISGENGGGGNRTRVTSIPAGPSVQGESVLSGPDEPRPRLCNTAGDAA